MVSDLTNQVEKLVQKNNLLNTESTQKIAKLTKNLEKSENQAHKLNIRLEEFLRIWKSLKLENKQLAKKNSVQRTQVDTLKKTLDSWKEYYKVSIFRSLIISRK